MNRIFYDLNTGLSLLEMDRLGIIITGQTRSFYTEKVFTSFYNWLTALRQTYKLYVVCIVNEDTINSEIFNRFINLCELVVIKRFDTPVCPPSEDYLNKIKDEMKMRAKPEDYTWEIQCIQQRYMSFLTQKKQTEEGVKILREHAIPTYIKTRFDIFYGIPLIPYSNPHPLFPHSRLIEEYQTGLLHEYGFSSFEEFNKFQKKMKEHSKGYFINENLYHLSFGGIFYYNTDIFDTNDKMWMSNDYVCIGSSKVFERYIESDLIEDIDTLIRLSREKCVNNLISPEPLMILHLYSVNITPLLLLNGRSIYIQRN